MAMNPRLLRPLARVAPMITPMATMVSTKSAGHIELYAESDSGFYKVMWWDSTSDVFASVGDINSKAASGAGEKTISIFACDENGAASGSLTYLYCNNNSLTSLDVSGLTALTALYCSGNSLTSLDVSGLTALTSMDCSGNSLTSLRAVGVAPTGYYSTSFAQYLGGFDLRNNSLSASALNQLYTDLANGTGILIVGGNPGTASDDPTIATAKGYTVYGS